LRKYGTRYFCDDVISAIRDEDGAMRGFSVITRDATQRIALREQTERSRDFYFALFSGFPNLVWRSDATGSCDYLNQAWLDYAGRPLEAEIGHGWLEGMHPEDRPKWNETLQQALSTRQSFGLEFPLRRADGEYGWMICSGRPYRDLSGGFSGFLCSCYDNTARRAMEDALKESEERYERITANVPGMVFRLRQAKDGKLIFLYVSHGCEALTGLSEVALASGAEAFFALIPDDDRPLLTAAMEASARQLTTWNWGGRRYRRHDTTEMGMTIRAKPRPSESDRT